MFPLSFDWLPKQMIPTQLGDIAAGGPSLVTLLIVAVLSAHALIAVAIVFHLARQAGRAPSEGLATTLRKSGYYYFAGAVSTLTVLSLCGIVWYVTIPFLDRYKIVSTAPSPDGKYIATVYTSCGPRLGLCDVRVNVNAATKPLNIQRAGYDWDHVVLEIDSLHEVSAKWEGDRELLISYRSLNKTFGTQLYKKPSDESGRVDIRYIEE